MHHFTILSFLLSAALILAMPVRRDHQYRDSKKVPVLKSGNALITSRYNVVYKQDLPHWHMTPADKIAQGDDTNRGFCRILPNSNAGGALHMWGTLNVFVMPEIARGKDCRFHFFLGSGDGAGGYSKLQLYSANPSKVGEFNTTWSNRPARGGKLGTFAIYPPKSLTDVNPVPDVVADIPNNYNEPAVAEEWTGKVHQQIVLKCPVGKVVYDLVPKATMANGIMPTVAWSLNKGLAIEILGVKKEDVPLWNPHDPTGA